MVAMSDFSAFSQMTYSRRRLVVLWTREEEGRKGTHWDTVGVLLAYALCLRFALLERMLVLELGTHGDGYVMAM
jgi:hypothetical protein